MENNNTKDIVITKVFDAPREKVWRAWSMPEEMKKWFGPKDFTAPTIEIDFKVGGRCLYCMHGVGMPGAEASNFWGFTTYTEIIPMERIVADDNFADKEGNAVPASYYGMPGDWSGKTEVVTTFAEEDGKTKMTLTQKGIPIEMHDMCAMGWSQSFDKLAESLK